VRNGLILSSYEKWLEINRFSLLCKPNTQKEAYKNFFATTWNSVAPQPFFRYEIYYAKLLPQRKSRPFVILQNNNLNRACFDGDYHSITVAPISSRLKGGEYRVTLEPREGLLKRSEIVVNALGIIDTGHIEFERKCLSKLTKEEIKALKTALQRLFWN